MNHKMYINHILPVLILVLLIKAIQCAPSKYNDFLRSVATNSYGIKQMDDMLFVPSQTKSGLLDTRSRWPDRTVIYSTTTNFSMSLSDLK